MVHAHAAQDQTRIELDLQWREIDVAKLIPGYGCKNGKIHTVPRTWAAMVQLRGLFGVNFTYDQELFDWTTEVRGSRVDAALAWRSVTEADLGLGDLYPFQQAGVGFLVTAQSGLLGDELGTGKTPQGCKFLEWTKALPAVVICPNGVKWHWASRLERWTPSCTPYIVDGAMNKRRQIIEAARKDPTAVVIINYESIRSFSRLAPYSSVKLKRCKRCDPKFGDDIKTQQCHVHPKELNGFGFKTAIIDEVHRCGEPTTQQTRSVWSVVHDPSVLYRWGFTGTPDNMKRLWSIMHTTAPHEYPTRSKFMDRYALMAWNAYGGSDVVGIRPDTREELFKILDPRFRRMIKGVVLPQLPPIMRQIRYATLTPSMRKSYNELEDHLFTVLPNGQAFIAQNKLVARTRLMQFCAGTVTVDKLDEDDVSSWKVHIGFPSPKIDELDLVLDELSNEKFTIACENVELANMAAERLASRGITHVLVAGSLHPSAVQQATNDLNNGNLRAIVFTHKKGGTGLDMSGAGIMIKLQRSWSLIEEVQSEGRNHRIGSEIHERVLIIDIVMKDTREEKQVETLHHKFEQLEEITRDRQQLTKRLQETSPSDANFASLVVRLNQLNVRQEELMRIDDIEQFAMEEG